MKHPLCSPLLPCLLSLFIFVSAQVQPMADEPEKVLSLNDAQTLEDVQAYVQYAVGQIDPNVDSKERAVKFADVFLAASDKMLGFGNDRAIGRAYSLKYSALSILAEADIEGAEQKLETFFNELESQDKTQPLALQYRFQWFVRTSQKTVKTPESFDRFKAELKQTWINRLVGIDFMSVVIQITEKNNASVEQTIKELVEYVRSNECTLLDSVKEETVKQIGECLLKYTFDFTLQCLK